MYVRVCVNLPLSAAKQIGERASDDWKEFINGIFDEIHVTVNASKNSKIRVLHRKFHKKRILGSRAGVLERRDGVVIRNQRFCHLCNWFHIMTLQIFF